MLCSGFLNQELDAGLVIAQTSSITRQTSSLSALLFAKPANLDGAAFRLSDNYLQTVILRAALSAALF